MMFMSYSSGGGISPGLIRHAYEKKITFKKSLFISPFIDCREV